MDFNTRGVAAKSFNFKPSEQKHGKCYSDLLNPEIKEGLGPVNLNWFQDCTSNKSARNQAAEETFNIPETALCPQSVTPGLVKNGSIDVPAIGMTPQLFSPDVPQGARKRRRQSTPKLQEEKLLLPCVGTADSPVTPGVGGFMPGQIRALMRREQSLDISPVLHRSFSQPCKDTYSSTKKMFKTPNTQAVRSVINTLGLDLNETAISWTSSLATPPQNIGKGWLTCTKSTEKSIISEDLSVANLGAARMLFSPGSQASLSQDAEYLEPNLNDTIEENPETVVDMQQPLEEQISPEVLDWHGSEPFIPLHDIESQLPAHKNENLQGRTTHSQRSSKHSTPNSSQKDITAIVNSDASCSKKKGLAGVMDDPASVSIDDVLSVFNTPPSRNTLRKRAAPKRGKSATITPLSSEDELGSPNVPCHKHPGCKSTLGVSTVSGTKEINITDKCPAGQSNSSQAAHKICNADANIDKPQFICNSTKDSLSEFPTLINDVQTGMCAAYSRDAVKVSSLPTKDGNTATAMPMSVISLDESDTDPEITFRTPAKVNQIKEEGWEVPVNSLKDSPANENFFTQISPSSLSAICEVAENTESSQQDMFQDESCHSRQRSTTESAVIHQSSEKHLMQLGKDPILNILNNVNSEGDNCQSNDIENDECEDHGLFTQLSPNAEQAMLEASESGKDQNNKSQEKKQLPVGRKDILKFSGRSSHLTPIKWKNVHNSKENNIMQNESSTMIKILPIDNAVPNMNSSKTVLSTKSGNCYSPSNENSCNVGNSRPSLSLKRKGKRFSYPTVNQIKETCPRRVFNFPVLDINDPIPPRTNENMKMVNSGTGKNILDANSVPHSTGMETSMETDNPVTDILATDGQDGCPKDISHLKMGKSDKSETPRSVPVPYWRKCNTGFTSLSSYNKSTSEKDNAERSATCTSPSPLVNTSPVSRSTVSQPPTTTGGKSVPGMDSVNIRYSPISNKTNMTTRLATQLFPSSDQGDVVDVQLSDRKPAELDFTKTTGMKQNTSACVGFQTASNKSIIISTKSLEKAANIIEEESAAVIIPSELVELPKEDIVYCGVNQVRASPGFPMQAPQQNIPSFQCASQKGKMLSVEAKNKAERLFREMEKDSTCDNYNEDTQIKESDNDEMPDCKVHNVVQNEPSLSVLEKLTSEFDQEFDYTRPNEVDVEKVENESCIMSADGKNKKTQFNNSGATPSPGFKMLATSDTGEEKDDNRCNTSKLEVELMVGNGNKAKSMSCQFTGFQSASGKAVQFSLEAQKRAENFIQEVNLGFEVDQNVRGKAVVDRSEDEGTVTATSVEIDRQTEQSNLDGFDYDYKDTLEKVKICKFAGFQSAGGRNIKLSATALMKAGQIMNEVDKQFKRDMTGAAEADSPSSHTQHLPQNVYVTETEVKKKDYSKVPKGYRPFKPPRLSLHSKDGSLADLNKATHAQISGHQVKNKDSIRQIWQGKEMDQSDWEITSNQRSMPCKPTQILTKIAEVDSYPVPACPKDNMNEVNGLTNTQQVEVSEGTAAFLFEADAPWTGFTQTIQNEKSEDVAISPCHSNLKCVAGNGKYGENIASAVTGNWCGFQTAGGRSVQVSATALENARKVICETDSGVNNHYGHSEVNDTENLDTNLKGNCVIVEVDSSDLNTGNKILFPVQTSTETPQDEPSEEVTCGNSKGVTPCSGFLGFHTAGGRKINVSETAVSQAKQMLDAIPNETVENGTDPNNRDINGSGTLEISVKDPKCFHESAAEISDNHCSNGNMNVATYDDLPALSCQQQKAGSPNIYQKENHVGNELKLPTESMRSLSVTESVPIAPTTNHNSPASVKSDIKDTFQSVPSCLGFQTASGKNVSISENALRQARCLLESGEDSSSATLSMETTVVQDCEPHTIPSNNKIGFQTVSGSEVCINQKALIKARRLIDSDNKDFLVSDSKGNEREVSNPFHSFQTAAGSKDKVSEISLKHARKLLDDETEVAPAVKKLSPMEGSIIFTKYQDQVKPFEGFSTAGGRQVSVSQSSLQEARILLDNVNSSQSLQPTNEASVSQAAVTQNHCFVGFETANGSKVSISDKSLSEARNLLGSDINIPIASDSQEIVDTVVSEHNIVSASGQFTGFQTARGQDVAISMHALKEAKEVLGGVNDLVPFASERVSIGQTSFSGFQTAAGRTVSVSKDALEHAKFLMESDVTSSPRERNDAIVPDDSNIVAKRLSFDGFHTAGGASVSVSINALEKARTILESKLGVNESRLTDIQMCPKQEAMSEFSERTTGNFDNDNGCNKSVTIHQQSVSCPESQLSLEKAEHIKLRKDATLIVSKNLDLSWEAAESAMALLADGLFEEDIDCDVDNQTKKIDEDFALTGKLVKKPGKAPRSDHERSTSGNENMMSKKCDDSWRAPMSTLPETVFQDRLHTGHGATNVSMVSAPAQDIYEVSKICKDASPRGSLKWPGPTTYKTNKDNQSCIAGKAKISSLQESETLSVRQMIASSVTSTSAGFVTPYKKPRYKNDIPCGTASKNSAQSFKTPVKRKIVGQESPDNQQGCDSGTDIPLQKKTKLDVNQRTHRSDSLNDDGNTDDKMFYSRSTLLQAKHIPEEVAKQRLKLQVAQAQHIKKKREEGGIKPIPGSLYMKKTLGGNRITLKAAVQGQRPQTCFKHQLYACAVLQSTVCVSSANAEAHRFCIADHFGTEVSFGGEGVKVGDGALLHFNSNNTAGKEEFCHAFLDLAGVDPKLICRDWVYNHYRWIVWKLAAYEVSFPWHFGGRCLTPDMMMLQLKYRYDREVDNSHRSALKKIFERDDTPAKTLVLCVSDILQLPTDATSTRIAATTKKSSPAKSTEEGLSKVWSASGVIEVTDGWYPIKVALDGPLTRLIQAKRLQIGDKFCTYGADLIGSQEAAPPLQAPGDVMLRISANSTRRVPWSTRLGYHCRLQPSPLPLSSLFPDGGHVSCVDVVVTRVYPIQYMEKVPDGTSVFRGARAEEKAASMYEREHQKKMEKLYSKLQVEFEKRESSVSRSGRTRRGGKRWTEKALTALQTGEDLYEALQTATDPTSVESCLNDWQRSQLADYKQQVAEKMQADLHAEFQQMLMEQQQEVPSRNIVPLLKVRITGCANKDLDLKANVMLSVWRPSDDVQQLLSEGKRLHIYNLAAGEVRTRRKDGAHVSLTAQRNTRYKEVPIEDNFLDVVYEPREVTSMAELCDGFHPPFSEVDIVGVVLYISGEGGHADGVYLADSSGDVCVVRFWGGLESAGLEDLISVKSLVAFGNLLWRHSDIGCSPVPTLVSGDLTTVSLNPRDAHLKYAMDRLRGHVKVKDMVIRDIASLGSETHFVPEMQESLQHVLTKQHYGSWQNAPATSLPKRKFLITPSSGRGSPRFGVSADDGMQSSNVRTPVYKVEQNPNSNTINSGNVTANCADQSESGELSHVETQPRVCYTKTDKCVSLTSDTDHQTMSTPNSCHETDPKLLAQKSLQATKAAKLAQYGTPPSLGNLSSPIPSAVRRAFKPPTMAKLATPTPCTRVKHMDISENPSS